MLFASGVLSTRSAVLELGCGVSALVGLALAPRVARYVLTDQAYVARLVEQNLDENSSVLLPAKGSGEKSRKGGGRGSSAAARWQDRIAFCALDWESSAVHAALTGTAALRSFDAVIACDCVYNEALIEPLVQTCVDTCRLRSRDTVSTGAGVDAGAEKDGPEKANEPPSARPCVVIIAQQLRDPDVFQRWMACFLRSFQAWRVPDERLPEELRSSSGFVVHVGVLREVVDLQER